MDFPRYSTAVRFWPQAAAAAVVGAGGFGEERRALSGPGDEGSAARAELSRRRISSSRRLRPRPGGGQPEPARIPSP